MADKPFVPIELEDEAVSDMLERIEHATGDLAPLMVAIRQELVSQTESNFASQGRPAWPTLAQATKDARQEKNKWPGSILQVSGALARSIVAEADEVSAMVGVGREVPYAAIHQLGGMAGRGKKVSIPARPYLPLIDGQLQPQAQESILELGREYLKNAALGESGK